jgi:hypothetical protein
VDERTRRTQREAARDGTVSARLRLAHEQRRAGRWAELQGLYVREIELTDDVERQIFLWARVAELRELLRLDKYEGVMSLEWERMWHPYLPEIDKALYHAAFNRWW